MCPTGRGLPAAGVAIPPLEKEAPEVLLARDVEVAAVSAESDCRGRAGTIARALSSAASVQQGATWSSSRWHVKVSNCFTIFICSTASISISLPTVVDGSGTKLEETKP
jgi:hypothetical protein